MAQRPRRNDCVLIHGASVVRDVAARDPIVWAPRTLPSESDAPAGYGYDYMASSGLANLVHSPVRAFVLTRHRLPSGLSGRRCRHPTPLVLCLAQL